MDAELCTLLARLVAGSGLTEATVAARAGVPAAVVRRILTGAQVPATVEPLVAVATACGANDHQRRAVSSAWYAYARGFPAMRQRVTAALWRVLGGTDALVDQPRRSADERAAIRREIRGGEPYPPGWDGLWCRDVRILKHRMRALDPWQRRAQHKEYETRVTLETLAFALVGPDEAVARYAADVIGEERDRRRSISRLTDSESRRLVATLDRMADATVRRWTEWGNDTAPADRERVEDGIRRLYELAGTAWHGQVWWVASPLAAARHEWQHRTAPLWTSETGGGDTGQEWTLRPDDLRRRMSWELRYLAGSELYEAATAVADRVWHRLHARAALRHLFVSCTVSGDRHLGAPGHAWHVREAPNWYPSIQGHLLAPWLARATLLQQVCGDRRAGTLWDRVDAYRDANAAGPWTPHADHAVVSGRPTTVHYEQSRLHRDDGPAIEWADGSAAYVVNGVRMPFDLIRDGWTAERILAEPNTELRRIAIERLGWDRFVTDAGLRLVDGPVPDPGNWGNTLSLYEIAFPDAREARLLLCTNASPDRDGTVRRFGLHVPATIDDAVDAAAWTFDIHPDMYRRLLRAT